MTLKTRFSDFLNEEAGSNTSILNKPLEELDIIFQPDEPFDHDDLEYNGREQEFSDSITLVDDEDNELVINFSYIVTASRGGIIDSSEPHLGDMPDDLSIESIWVDHVELNGEIIDTESVSRLFEEIKKKYKFI